MWVVCGVGVRCRRERESKDRRACGLCAVWCVCGGMCVRCGCAVWKVLVVWQKAVARGGDLHPTHNSTPPTSVLPLRYYWHNVTTRFTLPGGGTTIELEVLMYDSVVMCGNFLEDEGEGHLLSELRGPANATLAKEQLAWLTKRMAASTADYLWVGGHYPIWAIGQDGPTGAREQLRSLLNEHEAQYFNGHEHDFEHIRELNTSVNYISTGAGKECCYGDSNLNTVPIGSIQFAATGEGGAMWWGGTPIPPQHVQSGFTSYRVGNESMRVVYHASDGSILYATPPIAPRTKKPMPPPSPPQPFCSDLTCPHVDRGHDDESRDFDGKDGDCPGCPNLDFWCGKTWQDANTRCHTPCPHCQDPWCATCADGEQCFASCTSCAPPVPPPGPAVCGGRRCPGSGAYCCGQSEDSALCVNPAANQTCCRTAAASDAPRVCSGNQQCCAGQSFGSGATCCGKNQRCEFHVGGMPTCSSAAAE